MRKLSIILAVAFVATIGFTSCKKEVSLSGTVWVTNEPEPVIIFFKIAECDFFFPEKGSYVYLDYSYRPPNFESAMIT